MQINQYLAKAEYKLSKEDLDYLAGELEITEYSINEDGEKVPLAGWSQKEGYAYFFKKRKDLCS